MIDLILGGKSNGLWIARALAKITIDSTLLYCEEQPFAKHSKFIKKSIFYNNIESFIDEKRNNFNSTSVLLYPTSDYWVTFINENKNVLVESGFIFFDNNSRVINSFLDKLSFYQRFSKDFSIPETVNFKNYLESPFIIKPQKSFQKEKCIAKGFTQYQGTVKTPEFLVKQKQIFTDIDQHFSVAGIAFKGAIKAAIITRKILEYPSPGGTATLVSSVHEYNLNKQLFEFAQKFICCSHYSGAFEIEIIKKKNKLWLIELNARFWLQHCMVLSAGLNFSKIYRELLLGKKIKDVTLASVIYYSHNLLWIHEGMLISFLKISLVSKLKVIKILCKANLIKTYGYFSVEDPQPLIEYIKCKIFEKR